MKLSKVEPNKSKQEEETHPLYQQFIALQQEWHTYKNLIPFRQYSTTGSNIINGNFLQLMNKSPRELMSSLQNRRSPPAGFFWKARNNELAFEIVRERWAAIKSGKLKGRRLFGDSKEEREEICSGGFDLFEELSEVSSVGSHCCDDGIKGNCGNIKEEVEPLVCDEKVEGERFVEEREKRDGNGGRWMNGMGMFGIVLVVLVLVGIVSIRCNGGYVYENEVILVPT